ncbi:MAG: DUF2490 domain-containing protein [Pyrinomonadaceae bacterium]
MRTLLLAIFFMTMGQLTLAQSTVPETDFQIWNETTFVLPVLHSKDHDGKSHDRLSLLLIASLRLGQNRLAPVDERIGGGFDISLNKHFNFVPTYVYVATQPGRHRLDIEHRIRFDLGFAQKFRHFSIRDRNRVEYRIRNSRPDSVRYRNRISFHVPIHRDGKEVFAPYISDEPYYDFTARHWSRNDFTLGVGRKLNDQVSADFFAGWRHNRTGLPQDVFFTGVNLKVRLR